MVFDILEALQHQSELLDSLYDQNLKAARQLQSTLEHKILPGLVDEEGLDEADVEYAVQWLYDIPSIFRILKRQKFTASLALEALRTTLLWRLRTLPPLACKPPLPCFTCLPSHAHDPFGHPIVVIQTAKVLSGAEDLKALSAHTSELMRLHLVELNKARHSSVRGARPILQYVALLDIGGMSLSGWQFIDLMNWHVVELLPRYPGMLAAVFILNYSWTHSGFWSIAKRILPKHSLQKIFFVTAPQLRQLLSPANLPKDYGGDLPLIAEMPSPLEQYVASPPAASDSPGAHCAEYPLTGSMVDPEATSPEATAPIRTVLSSTSLLNPFFGYPAVYDAAATPSLRHGRRRKRDLVHTLVRLWWARWGARAVLMLVLLLLLLVARRWRIQLRVIFDRRRPTVLPVRAFLPWFRNVFWRTYPRAALYLTRAHAEVIVPRHT
ncbi:uncharacterized protein PHACADRAFT_124083 [Phanerochaete carnosa HHB-10118-sp]|uniref:CRAL-TRIO domain-containing protein n=1 Tax=Phanerochaete carnosa (strain HHB-10118-sp) TaxID=650164 RepID=K5W6Z1_PHACS|nr:uncharacterized protein PHACADRAFT_124083 [Phanerochaete carnosa HHB-10118-sp]EKM54729.1 hypothetical protein PHACADRAFT_124083 [Phanerochaete carnosa HHB-10118-sp]